MICQELSPVAATTFRGVISIRKNKRLYLGISVANLFEDYFLRGAILVPDYSGVSETHALSSICLLHKRAVYAIDKFNYFFRVQRSICDEDNREGKSIIYRGGFNINYI